MKPRQIPWKWLLLGLAALLLVGIAVLPRQFGDSSRLAGRVAESLAAWSGGELKLTGPLRVHYFPDVALKSGFEITNASRLPLVKSIKARNAKISLDLGELLLGRIKIDALRLLGPEIALKDVPSLVMGPDQTLEARVVNLFGGTPVDVIRLRGGTIEVPTASGTETITKIDARFDASSGDGAVSSTGTFMLRNEPVSFSLTSAAPVASPDGLRIPLRLSLASALLAAQVTGTASLTNGLQLDGDVQADTKNLRGLLRWAGIALPEGHSLQRMSASGMAHWNGTTLTFDDGSFALDGNVAVGLLALMPGARPRIDGTLAFDRLALDPYVEGGTTIEPAQAPIALADQAVLKHLDVDLRISAGEIALPPVTLGRGAFTISAKGGLVASEVGELEICGGQASGRAGLDVREDTTKVTFAASLLDVPVEACLGAFQLDVPLSGVSDLKAEGAAVGRDYEDLVQALAGSFTVNARSGSVPVDFSRLLAAAPPLDADSWTRSSVTVFDQLKADCRLDAGHIWCDTFNMQTRRGLISGSGGIDLWRRAIDWGLFVASHDQPLRASQLRSEMPPRISISGSLGQPMIRRVDRPTIGEGSGRANPAANQISPR
jgi:AsmA protein